jgi:hypothetical protein
LLAKAREINKDLQKRGMQAGSPELALRIAKSEAKFQPTPSEELQGGPANRVTTRVTTETPKSNDFMERRRAAVDRANEQMKVGRG